MLRSNETCESEIDTRAPAHVGHSRSARILRDYRNFAEFEMLCGTVGDHWLSRREQAELSAWRDERRRRAWLLGRAVAKRLVAGFIALRAEPSSVPPEAIEILSRDTAGRVNRPLVWIEGRLRPWSLSISHSHRGVLAALAGSDTVSLGVDLADSAAFGDGFVELWFTPAEREWFVETGSTSIACFIWAAKEALYKACNTGESFAPREFEIRPDGRASYRGRSLVGCRLQSFTIDSQLAVVASVARDPALTRLSPTATNG
ncbi:MAG: 4'-phosphopantetheinyl transferase superfamily protein [Pirellulales bacterium]